MKIDISGTETERNDGSIVCIGYGADSDGNVTGCFALPDGSEWDAPDATDSVEYVDSMDKLPAVNSQYLGE